MNKFGAIRTEIDGHVFHSRKEARRYQDLKLLLNAGHILCLTLQPSYEITINGFKVCRVILDFEYMTKDGKRVTEDVKGGTATLTPLSRLKHKLVRAQHGVEVVIV